MAQAKQCDRIIPEASPNKLTPMLHLPRRQVPTRQTTWPNIEHLQRSYKKPRTQKKLKQRAEPTKQNQLRKTRKTGHGTRALGTPSVPQPTIFLAPNSPTAPISFHGPRASMSPKSARGDSGAPTALADPHGTSASLA